MKKSDFEQIEKIKAFFVLFLGLYGLNLPGPKIMRILEEGDEQLQEEAVVFFKQFTEPITLALYRDALRVGARLIEEGSRAKGLSLVDSKEEVIFSALRDMVLQSLKSKR